MRTVSLRIIREAENFTDGFIPWRAHQGAYGVHGFRGPCWTETSGEITAPRSLDRGWLIAEVAVGHCNGINLAVRQIVKVRHRGRKPIRK